MVLVYFINSAGFDKKGTTIFLEKKGKMPMPLDVVVTYTDKKLTQFKTYHIPLEIMRGHKKDELLNGKQTLKKDWKWTHKVYQLNIDIPLQAIEKIEIDPSMRMADTDRENNLWEK